MSTAVRSIEFDLKGSASRHNQRLESRHIGNVTPERIRNACIEICGACPDVLHCWPKYDYAGFLGLRSGISIRGADINSETCLLRTYGVTDSFF